ncbi:MAG: DUF6789 family protein [Rhizomicrobium sp.]
MPMIMRGMIAGLVATLALSALMMMKTMMGMMPQLNIITMLSAMAGTQSPLVGWLIHVVIGTFVWGTLFAVVQGWLPGTTATMRGVVFGILAWLMMMIVVMPMAGVGVFGLKFGIAAPVMTLMLHIVYGATLGASFAWQAEPART